MEEPIKIIWKYKNNNRRVQYGIYIFVGSISNTIKQVLNKIENISFYDALIELSDQDNKILNNKYGAKWYQYFYNFHHINNIINTIKDTATKKKEIIAKYGQQWYNEHIESHKLTEKRLIYTYEAMIKDENLRKTVKKGKVREYGSEEDADLDYTIAVSKFKSDAKKITKHESSDSVTTESLSELNLLNNSNIHKKTSLYGGHQHNNNCQCDCHNEQLDDEEDDNQVGGEDDNQVRGEDEVEVELNETNNDEDSELEEGLDMNEITSDEEIDLEEIGEIYKDVDLIPDKNVTQTTNLIKKALENENIFEKQQSKILEFDSTNDDDGYDTNLKDVFNKHYITTQYIFKDDTIKMIKNKICSGVKNNKKFGKDFYVLPSRQYLWSEYVFNDKIEKVMIGQKWIRRSELLHVDVEPSSNFSIYEELRGNLKILRDNLKRINKIKWENDENNILYDYDGYYTNNKIYMVDIYNELGTKYNPSSEVLKNITEVYMQLYFKRIKNEDIKYILESLNGESKTEESKIELGFETIYNDLFMENEIMNVVEEVKDTTKYKVIFKDNFITQSVIHVNLRVQTGKIDLFRIFNEFVPSDKYPFIQYQTQDGQIVFKFKENVIYNYIKIKENSDVISKWFENSPYGISFKIKITDKDKNERFTAINLNESGRIEYKTQWKEEDMATLNDINKTYVYVKDLLKILNKDKNRVTFEDPYDSEFKFAFINTIQKFELPEKYTINHNDLSDFCRFFYPYVSTVIEPRKRHSKIQKGDDKSKFGTYLRYKRVSKYDNPIRIEQRIMYFMRNYDYNDTFLINEISKQFNITEEKAFEEIERVRQKYPNLRKSRKILKKLENIPKYKPPGIGIDIQGKTRDKYKIRISGARDKQQLDRIINFMNILLFLYAETYLYKKPERQVLKEKLKKLTNIAKRRGMVEEVVNYEKNIKTIKQMTLLDKYRIGNKPEQGQNQYSRDCQNSGKEHRRRPKLYNMSNIGDMIKAGYKLNKKTGEYERKTIVKDKKGKKIEITLKSLKLPELDVEGKPTGDEIHYTCSPDNNGQDIYVGFLTRSISPYGYCKPCCFKKDPALTVNKNKQEILKKCMGEANTETVKDNNNSEDIKILGEKLYILQDTNKIQEGRFGFLPKYLDIYFNLLLNKEKEIKQHYLTKTKTGYFFKYGSKQDEYQFLNAISSIFGLSIDDIKKRMTSILSNDTNEQIFTSLNNGDIKTQFKSINAFSEYIKNSNYLDYDIVQSLLSIPKVITTHGINIIVFNKKIHIIKKLLEKETSKEDFYLNCQDYENIINITDPKRETIFLLKENKNYYPIIMVKKEDEENKTMELTKTFNYKNEKNNIINYILDYFKKNCFGSFLDDILYKNKSLTAKEMYYKLNTLERDFQPKYQVIDVRNKCKNIIIQNGLMLPVRPSGSIYNLQIIKQPDKYIHGFKQTYDMLNKIYTTSKNEINVKPIGIFFDDIKNNDYNVIAIMTQTHDSVEITPEIISKKTLDNMHLIYENKPLFDKIDKDIQKGKTTKIDDRITKIGDEKYMSESYELFRLEFSEFINKDENVKLKKKFESYMNDNKITYHEKLTKIRLLLYGIINKDLLPLYEKTVKLSDSTITDVLTDNDNDTNVLTDTDEANAQTGGKLEKLVYVLDKKPDTTKYQLNNDRNVCKELEKDTCSTNIHCHWSHSGCLIALTEEMIISFINKISAELAKNELRAMELMRYGNYFVSDIVDYTRFTEREGQKIVRSNSNSIKKVLVDIFGKSNTPIIGKRKIIKGSDLNNDEIINLYPLKELKNLYIQPIIHNNLTIYRSYVNAYYWLKNEFYDLDNRNLGFYSLIQTDLANYFKSLVIDWLTNVKNKDEIEKELIKYMNIKKTSKDIIADFTTKISNDTQLVTNCIVELYIINKIQGIPIVVYNEEDEIIYIYDNGLIYNKNNKSTDKINKYENKPNYINLQFNMGKSIIPEDISVIYFKNQ